MIQSELYIPSSLDDALRALAAGPATASRPIAGATWIMRASLRQERPPSQYVALGRLEELRKVTASDTSVTLGACLTHAELNVALSGMPELKALHSAVTNAANPAIRQVATLGGNLCAVNFPAADLPPALLALEASVVYCSYAAGAQAIEVLPLEDFLRERRRLVTEALVTAVRVPRGKRRSVHSRLTFKSSGDYPVAIVSMAAESSEEGRLQRVRIAVGSVGAVAQRWSELEDALENSSPDPARAAELASGLTSRLETREGIEAPASYRKQVLPALVKDAVAKLAAEASRERTSP